MSIDIHLCTADLGAGQPGAGLGPHAVLTAAQRGLQLTPSAIIDGPQRWAHLNRPSIEVLDSLIETGQAQCRAMAQSLRKAAACWTLSGDHANAVGWLSGVREAFPKGRIGVVWIDAHGDLHTPGTSPSGNVHGMPLGALLGCNDGRTDFKTLRAWRQWQRLGNPQLWPKLDPRDLALVEFATSSPPSGPASTTCRSPATRRPSVRCGASTTSSPSCRPASPITTRSRLF